MGEMLWTIFSNPRTIAGPEDAPFIIAAALLVALLTLGFMAMVGKRISRLSGILAALIGTAFVPALIVLIAIILLKLAPNGPPPNDGPAMLFMGLIVLAICALPVSLAASALYVVRRRRANLR
jgi:phosphatidylglycerophosphate synthase